MIGHAHRFVFIHVPKTGGNSVQWALRDASEDRIHVRDPLRQDGVHRFAVADSLGLGLEKHAIWSDYRAACGARIAGYLHFATMRNPYTRLVSHYFSPHRGSVAADAGAFEDFVRRVPPLEHYVCDGAGALRVDLLLRFERLAADFALACQRIGLAPRPLPRLNAGQPRDIRPLWSDRLRDFVAERHAFEIALGGYRFGAAPAEEGGG